MFCLLASPCLAGTPTFIQKIEIEGTKNTDRDWLIEYIGLTLPVASDQIDLDKIRAKILTTDVFTKVAVRMHDDVLVVDVEEKWTIVPVLRAAYGGGTPLLVAGGYNIHTFGRLWTLGAETRKYGNAPIGGIVYAKAPRWLDGRYALGFELWRDFHKRYIFDDDFNQTGHIDSDSTIFRTQILVPMLQDRVSYNLQFGLNAEFRREAPSTFEPKDEGGLNAAPSDIELSDTLTSEYFLAPTIVFDNVTIDQLNMDGLRLILKAGPSFVESKSFERVEVEAFYYYLFGDAWDLSTHLFVGGTESKRVQSLYFLGGLESVRGIPEGAMYGQKAYYSNIELRKEMARFHYLHLQSVVFCDSGSAVDEWHDLYREKVSTAGLGMRFSIPQVYRMTFRVDYAWGIERSKSSGLSIGLNQFFQPYKPL